MLTPQKKNVQYGLNKLQLFISSYNKLKEKIIGEEI